MIQISYRANNYTNEYQNFLVTSTVNSTILTLKRVIDHQKFKSIWRCDAKKQEESRCIHIITEREKFFKTKM